MRTFRAAYIPAKPGDNGAGICLTGESDQDLTDDELREKAIKAIDEIGLHAFVEFDDEEIQIGEWREK